MANFVVRVVLHSKKTVDHPDYVRLHSAMESAVFTRHIQDENTKIWYHLPAAEYLISNNLTVDEIINKVRTIVITIDSDYGVFTVETKGAFRWFGLKRI
jgi:hypothetical protein